MEAGKQGNNNDSDENDDDNDEDGRHSDESDSLICRPTVVRRGGNTQLYSGSPKRKRISVSEFMPKFYKRDEKSKLGKAPTSFKFVHTFYHFTILLWVK